MTDSEQRSTKVASLVLGSSIVLTSVLWGTILMLIPRGFDLTDNGAYLLSYLNYDDVTATLSMANALILPLYDLLGTQTMSFRVVGGLLLLFISILVSPILLNFFKHDLHFAISSKLYAAYVVALVAAASSHYHRWLAVTPNYNTINLLGVITFTVGTILWLRVDYQKQTRIAPALIMLGFMLSFWGKATTAALMPFVSLVLLFTYRKYWRELLTWTHVLCGAIGLGVGLLLPLMSEPSYASLFDKLNQGLTLQVVATDAYGGFGLTNLINVLVSFFFPLIEYLRVFWVCLAVPSVIIVLISLYWRQADTKDDLQAMMPVVSWILVISWFVNALIIACMPIMYATGATLIILYALTAYHIVLYLTARGQFERADDISTEAEPLYRAVAWSLCAFALPSIYSFGTNVLFALHTADANYFYALAIFLLILPLRHPIARPLQFAFPIMFIVVVGVYMWQTTGQPYRQAESLFSMTTPVSVRYGDDTIQVGDEVATYATAIQALAQENDFQRGTTVIDLTGRSPGAVYIIDGRSPVAPWLSGGFPFSNTLTAAILDRWDAEELARAWIITVVGDGLLELPTDLVIEAGLDFPRDYTLVGTIQRPYDSEIQAFWRPSP